MPTRFVAVSATMPNIEDVGEFLECTPESTFSFDESYRPVPLETHIKACGNANNQYLFEQHLQKYVPAVISEFSSGRPTIVFCHSKKDTETLSREMGAKNSYVHSNNRSVLQVRKRERAAHNALVCGPLFTRFLKSAAASAQTSGLAACLRTGTAYHNAGLPSEDRDLVEKMFLGGHIRVLCATSTLAVGVNLPAHLVIIKGTKVWRGAGQGHVDIDTGTLMQMMGRAGRPGFDTTGKAVIMTDNGSAAYFGDRIKGAEIIESRLRDKLVETLNAEISQTVVTSSADALVWMRSTFFYTRVKRNPRLYDLRVGQSAEQVRPAKRGELG